jgi:hypothetical protein
MFSLVAIFLLLIPSLEAGFDFGSGCEGGSGQFNVTLTQEGQKILIGEM